MFFVLRPTALFFLFILSAGAFAADNADESSLCKFALERKEAYELKKAEILKKRRKVLPKLLWEEPSEESLATFHTQWETIQNLAAHHEGSFFIERSNANVPLFDRLILVSGTLAAETSDGLLKRYSANKEIFENWFAARELVKQKISMGQHPTASDLAEIILKVGSVVRPIDFIPSFKTSSHWKDIPAETAKLDAWYEQKRNTLHPIALAALYAQKLLTIHPADDGNGRTARIVQEWILALNHLPAPFYSDRYEAAIARSWEPENDVSPMEAIRRTTNAVQRAVEFFTKTETAETQPTRPR